jgi:hypothetical protein
MATGRNNIGHNWPLHTKNAQKNLTNTTGFATQRSQGQRKA